LLLLLLLLFSLISVPIHGWCQGKQSQRCIHELDDGRVVAWRGACHAQEVDVRGQAVQLGSRFRLRLRGGDGVPVAFLVVVGFAGVNAGNHLGEGGEAALEVADGAQVGRAEVARVGPVVDGVEDLVDEREELDGAACRREDLGRRC
jgi:hypothetical protein